MKTLHKPEEIQKHKYKPGSTTRMPKIQDMNHLQERKQRNLDDTIEITTKFLREEAVQ